MSTAVIYNGFGQYEQNEALQRGITVDYAGVPFWLPYKALTYIPDYTFRFPDQTAMAEAGEEGEGFVIYKTATVPGHRIAHEILEKQIPTPNSRKGLVLIKINDAKKKNSYTTIPSGVDEGGTLLSAEVQEVAPTQAEVDDAHKLAQSYKEDRIKAYFQSKRERMAGGHGQLFPTGMIEVFMEELGVPDLDDVSKMIPQPAYAPTPAPAVLTPELLAQLRAEITADIMAAMTAPAPVQAPVAPAPPPAVVSKKDSAKGLI